VADRQLHPESLAVGLGYDPAQAFGAAKPPIVLTSTFVYPSAEAARDRHAAFFDGDGPAADAGPIYARLGHPNLDMVEARMAALDGAEACAGFASGMAAISAVALALLRPGDSAIHSRPVYGGTDSLMAEVAPEIGVSVQRVANGVEEAAWRAAILAARASGPLRLIMLETPANPTAALVDIALVRGIADETGEPPIISVDNTFLGPLLQRPLEHGADLVITSLTKYCGGHSDLLAGSVSGGTDVIGRLKRLRTLLGSHMEPFTAWLVLRSLESLAVRQRRAVESAAAVAAFLSSHPKVVHLTWLGSLADGSPEQAVFQRQCGAAGSTFSFTIRGGESEAFRMLNALKLLKLAVSLGGSETLICHPATTTHYNVSAAARAEGGIGEGTLRVSIGLEHPEDLIADLTRALETV
jgi:cystathionine gamma-synthase/methionine-gamma-lyase